MDYVFYGCFSLFFVSASIAVLTWAFLNMQKIERNEKGEIILPARTKSKMTVYNPSKDPERILKGLDEDQFANL